MLTSLQSQVPLMTVQVLVCNIVLALWRCESSQLCKILLAGTALMTWHLGKIWKLTFNCSLMGQEDIGLSCAGEVQVGSQEEFLHGKACRHWLPKEVVDSPSLEVSQEHLA